MLWTCNLRDLAAAAQGKEAQFRGRLRPYFDAGSWDSTRYAVWMRAPGAVLKGDTIGPFTFGRELYSRAGNVNGSIADGDSGTFRVTFDDKPQAQAYFGIAIEKPVKIGRATYVAGNIFHDGGWFDAAGGKPKFQVKKTAGGPWVDVAVFEDLPCHDGDGCQGHPAGHAIHGEIRARGSRRDSHHRQTRLRRQSGPGFRLVCGTGGNGGSRSW